jgi:hypothetical protein
MFDDFESDTILFSNGIWKIIGNNGFPYMVKVNCDSPVYNYMLSTPYAYPNQGTLNKQNPSFDNKYRYIISYSRFVLGDVEAKRNNTELLFETGTAVGGSELATAQTFFEVSTYNEIKQTGKIQSGYEQDAQCLTPIITPRHEKSITHCSIYRTKNVRQDSGNNPAQYTWVDDIQMGGVFRITVSDGKIVLRSFTTGLPRCLTSNFFDIVNGPVGLTSTQLQLTADELNDGASAAKLVNTVSVGKTMTAVDLGATTFFPSYVGATVFFPDGTTNTIATYVSSSQVTLSSTPATASNVSVTIRFAERTQLVSPADAGVVTGTYLPPGTYDIAYGNGYCANINTVAATKIMSCDTDEFDPIDVGKTIFLLNGQTNVIAEYIDAKTVKLLNDPINATDVPMTRVGWDGFTISYYDSVMDDGKKTNEEGLQERILANNSLYYAQYAYRPMSDCDIGTITNGMLFTATRGGQVVQYTAIGDKPYIAGAYRNDEQFENIHASISTIIKQSGQLSIVCVDRVMANDLTALMSNIGISALGEYIPKINPFIQTDMRIGCRHWRTLIPVAPGKWMGVTSEPAVRMFNGKAWSSENYAALNNVSAIMEDLRSVGPCDLMAAYSDRDGYLIFGERYTDSELMFPEEDLVSTITVGDFLDIGGSHESDTMFLRYLDVGGVRT